MTFFKKDKPKSGPKKSNKLTSDDLKIVAFDFLKRNAKSAFSARQLIKQLRVSNNKDAVSHVLEALEKEGKVTREADSNCYYVATRRTTTPSLALVGTVDMTKSGDAYITVKELENDVFVKFNNLGTAQHGDTVKIKLLPSRNRVKQEGVVVSVVERSTEYFLGTIQIKRNKIKLIPDSTRFYEDIIIPADKLGAASDNDKAIVKIISWGEGSKLKPIGVVTTVLGKLDSNELEMNAILIQNGFNITFSEQVMAEAAKIKTEILPTEIEQRRDFRTVTTFTIDPFDAKDFDDALSFRYLNENRYEVGIHIADVSHYLKKGTEMDKEAYLRSTSVYLVDRCCPMLPEKLSNELCSLRPNEDKLTFSAVFTFDDKDQIVDKWFGKTIIHSNRRFTYEEAQTIIETKKGPFEKEITKLNELALKLRKKRFRNGAINFESDEIGIKLDENKKPIAIYIKERKDSNKMIEEFMLLANKEVAKFIAKKEKGIQQIPFIYRIHDLPNHEKVEDLLTFAMEFGFKLDPKNVSKSFNQLVLESEKNEALKVIIPLAIRTMAKAEYSSENIGHYGLAFEHYSHFTSPIRRYSDVIAHRLLEKNLNTIYRTDLATLDNQCSHISRQERKAMECERESIKYKQVEFMEHSVGGTFKARVSGMSEKGFFAEMVDNKCEGMVKFETLNETYDLDPTKLKAMARRSKKVIKIGDLIQVKVESADLKSRRIDLELVDG